MTFRDDVVLETVCGIVMLVALRPAWGECPAVLQVGPLSGLFWEKTKAGCPTEEILSAADARFHLGEERARRMYDGFLRDCRKYHYILPEEAE